MMCMITLNYNYFCKKTFDCVKKKWVISAYRWMQQNERLKKPSLVFDEGVTTKVRHCADYVF